MRWAISLFLIISTMGAVPSAFAGPHVRVWRGWAAEDSRSSDLASRLSEALIPGVARWGGGAGLQAYVPALLLEPAALKRLRIGGYPLPDGVALLAFESEAAYRRLNQGTRGQTYRDLHEEAFDPLRSHSLVVSPYRGTLIPERAYGIVDPDGGWHPDSDRGEELMVSLHLRRSDSPRQAYLGQLNLYVAASRQVHSTVGLKGHALLVAEKYWIEYRLFEADSAATALAHPFQQLTEPVQEEAFSLPVKAFTPGTDVLKFGEAAAVRF